MYKYFCVNLCTSQIHQSMANVSHLKSAPHQHLYLSYLMLSEGLWSQRRVLPARHYQHISLVVQAGKGI